jgi:hypothetical protein
MRHGDFQERAQSYAAYLSSASSPKNNPNSPDGKTYSTSPDNLSAGPNKNEYPAAYINDLTEEEKELYIEKINFLNSRTRNIIFDFKTELSTQGFAISDGNASNLTENSYKVTKEGALVDKFQKRDVPQSFIDLTDPSSFYPSLALLCMLVELIDGADGLVIRGGFGLHRGKNLADLAAKTTSEGDGVSDHAFGRGFDIHSVSQGEGRPTHSFEDAIGKIEEYYNGLHLLLQKISLLPKFLQPDSIVFAGSMTSKYTEDDDKVRQQYPRSWSSHRFWF